MKKKIALLLLSLIIISTGIGMFIYYQPATYPIKNRVKQMIKTEEKYKDPVIGWLRVEGTNIDLPLIYATTQEKVSKGTYNFAWSIYKNDQLQNKVTFMSHNIQNVSSHPLKNSEKFVRFEALPAFLYEDFARKNQFIQYTVGGKNYLYRIFSVAIVKKTEIKYAKDNYPKEKLQKYIANSLKESYYKYDTDVSANDKILTLTTCTRFFGRSSDYVLRIDARKIRSFEKKEPVSMKTTLNYVNIKKTMEQ